jgi:hypothetical protein
MTATTIDWSDVEAAARELANNHSAFGSFAWFESPPDAENWCLVYTNNRDSGLREQSNAHAIDAELEKWTEGDDPDVIPQHHTHWACGWVDGFAIRVYRDGAVTDAFRRWCELQDFLDGYPVLDDEDYSARELEATLENIRLVCGRLVRDDAPEGWPSQVYEWLSENDERAIENTDDQGGCPSDEQAKVALSSLRLLDGQEFPAVGDYVTEDYVRWEEYGTGYFLFLTANDWKEFVRAHRDANNPTADVWVLTEHGYYERELED